MVGLPASLLWPFSNNQLLRDQSNDDHPTIGFVSMAGWFPHTGRGMSARPPMSLTQWVFLSARVDSIIPRFVDLAGWSWWSSED